MGVALTQHTHAPPCQTLLVLLVIGLYGVVGMLLFWQTGLYPADAIENFNTAPSAILSVFVLYSSENYPGKRGSANFLVCACYAIITLIWFSPTTNHHLFTDVMYPATHGGSSASSAWYTLYFISFLIIGMFSLANLVVPILYAVIIDTSLFSTHVFN